MENIKTPIQHNEARNRIKMSTDETTKTVPIFRQDYVENSKESTRQKNKQKSSLQQVHRIQGQHKMRIKFQHTCNEQIKYKIHVTTDFKIAPQIPETLM